MPLAGTKYNFSQLKSLWVQAGGNATYSSIAAAVSMAESSGYSGASNDNSNGSIDRGLWQINSTHGSQSSFDPLTNAKGAVSLSDNGTNWRAWCTAYTDGACGTDGGSYSLTSGSPVAKALASGGGGTVPGSDTSGATDTTATASNASFLGDIGNLLGLPDITDAWESIINTSAMIMLFIGGTLLIVLAFVIFFLDTSTVKELASTTVMEAAAA